MFTNLNLTDMETCYKMFRTSIIQNIKLKEKRFGFEPEITAKISRIPEIILYHKIQSIFQVITTKPTNQNNPILKF